MFNKTKHITISGDILGMHLHEDGHLDIAIKTDVYLYEFVLNTYLKRTGKVSVRIEVEE